MTFEYSAYQAGYYHNVSLRQSVGSYPAGTQFERVRLTLEQGLVTADGQELGHLTSPDRLARQTLIDWNEHIVNEDCYEPTGDERMVLRIAFTLTRLLPKVSLSQIFLHSQSGGLSDTTRATLIAAVSAQNDTESDSPPPVAPTVALADLHMTPPASAAEDRGAVMATINKVLAEPARDLTPTEDEFLSMLQEFERSVAALPTASLQNASLWAMSDETATTFILTQVLGRYATASASV